MSEDGLCLLRMVIQQLGASENAAYRVVVYGDRQQPRHSDFGDAQILLNAVHASIPEFDLSRIVLSPLAKGLGSLAFVGEMTLDEAQLSLLGLK